MSQQPTQPDVFIPHPGPVPISPYPTAVNPQQLSTMERAIIEMSSANQNTNMLLQSHEALFVNISHILDSLSTRTAQNTSTSTTTTSSSKKFTVAKPQFFNGDPRNFDTFITSVLINFNADPDTYCTDKRKIFFVLSYMMQGEAKSWAERIVETMNSETAVKPTWPIFEEHLRSTFQDTNKETDAQNNLDNIKQGDMTADQFFIKFDEYFLRSGYNEKTAIHYIKRAINRPLITRLITAPNPPETYEAWKKAIIQLDRQFRQGIAQNLLQAPRTFNNFNRNRSPYAFSPNTTVPTPADTTTVPTTSPSNSGVQPGAGAPMQIDAITQPANSSIRCYNCNQKGHYSRQCPLPNRRIGQPKASIRRLATDLTDEDRLEMIRVLHELDTTEQLEEDVEDELDEDFQDIDE